MCVKAQQWCVKVPFTPTAVFFHTFYFCHFHSTACAKRFAFICHVTVFLKKNSPQNHHPLYFFLSLFSLHLAPFKVLLHRPLPHLSNKVPTRNKASLFKEATASKAFLASLSFFSLFFFSYPALSALFSLLGFATRLAYPLTDL